MQFLRFLAVVCLLNFTAEADARERLPSVTNEYQRRKSAGKCSDTTPLLNKLISELEHMKGQIIHEMPKQLTKLRDDLKEVKGQGEEIKKLRDDLKEVKGQCEEMKKLRDDLKEIKGIDIEIREQLKKQETDIQEIKMSTNYSNSGSSSVCNVQPSLRRIELSVENIANRTQQISESLQSHDKIVTGKCTLSYVG